MAWRMMSVLSSKVSDHHHAAGACHDVFLCLVLILSSLLLVIGSETSRAEGKNNSTTSSSRPNFIYNYNNMKNSLSQSTTGPYRANPSSLSTPSSPNSSPTSPISSQSAYPKRSSRRKPMASPSRTTGNVPRGGGRISPSASPGPRSSTTNASILEAGPFLSTSLQSSRRSNISRVGAAPVRVSTSRVGAAPVRVNTSREGAAPVRVNTSRVGAAVGSSNTSRVGSGFNSSSTPHLHNSRSLGSHGYHNFDTGQFVRFRAGQTSYNEGRLELFYNGRWSGICADRWTQTHAHLACKQLGFVDGALPWKVIKFSEEIDNAHTELLATHDRTHRASSPHTGLLSITCAEGNESRTAGLEQCDVTQSVGCVASASGSVSVRCIANTGCEKGWVTGVGGVCYKLETTPLPFSSAERACHSLNARLLRIDNQSENDFISNYLLAESAERRLWTSGRLSTADPISPTDPAGRSSMSRPSIMTSTNSTSSPEQDWRWTGAAHAMTFTKWFPGWPPSSVRRQPMLVPGRNCLALAHTFFDSAWITRDVRYHYWSNWPCDHPLPYLCKKFQQLAHNDCYEDDGSTYRGFAHFTLKGSVCQKWTTSSKLNQTTHPQAGLGDHNYCRNPDSDKRPWCWVDTQLNTFGYCALPVCNARCDWEREIECGGGGSDGNLDIGAPGGRRTSCLPLSLVCDGEPHCQDGSDEQACRRDQFSISLTPISDREVDDEGSSEGDGGEEGIGRVEVKINNITGTICSDGWDHQDATVVCRMLGYREGVAVFVPRSRQSQVQGQNEGQGPSVQGQREGQGPVHGENKGQGPVWFNDVQCTGRESNLLDCDRAPLGGQYDCSREEGGGRRGVIGGEEAGRGRGAAGVRCHNPLRSSNGGVEVCGRRPIAQPQARIIGGREALYGAYPWQARIFKRNSSREQYQHSCGGTIISKNWIITAAHCFESSRKEQFRLRVGDHHNIRVDAFEQELSIEEIVSHPQYLSSFISRGSMYDYDVALVRVRSTALTSSPHIIFNDYVQPACLPSSSPPRTSDSGSDYYTPGRLCDISGWGLSRLDLPISLRYGQVPILNQRSCQRSYSGTLTVNMFCAGYRQGTVDTCQGDSGGPLVCHINGSYTVLGITSWGHGCGHHGLPGVYTKVGQLVDWIQNTIHSRTTQ